MAGAVPTSSQLPGLLPGAVFFVRIEAGVGDDTGRRKDSLWLCVSLGQIWTSLTWGGSRTLVAVH